MAAMDEEFTTRVSVERHVSIIVNQAVLQGDVVVARRRLQSGRAVNVLAMALLGGSAVGVDGHADIGVGYPQILKSDTHIIPEGGVSIGVSGGRPGGTCYSGPDGVIVAAGENYRSVICA